MCKNENKNEHHDRKLEKTIESAIVENDFKKYCHKPKYLGYQDLQFDGLYAEIEFPNGFVMMVSKDNRGNIEEIEIRDAIDGWNHSRAAVFMFPELNAQWQKLNKAADTMIVSDAMRKVQELTREDWKKFRNGE